MSRIFTIDPHVRAIVESAHDFGENDGTPFISTLIDADMAIVLNPEGRDLIWCDPKGADVDGQRWFALAGIGAPIAGRVALVSPDDSPVSLAGLSSQVSWLDIEFKGMIREQIGPYDHPEKGVLPAFVEYPNFEVLGPPVPASSSPAEAAKALPRMVWTIYREPDGFAAHGFREGKPRAVQILENETLEDLRSMLPPGLTRIPRSEKDAADVEENWI